MSDLNSPPVGVAPPGVPMAMGPNGLPMVSYHMVYGYWMPPKSSGDQTSTPATKRKFITAPEYDENKHGSFPLAKRAAVGADFDQPLPSGSGNSFISLAGCSSSNNPNPNDLDFGPNPPIDITGSPKITELPDPQKEEKKKERNRIAAAKCRRKKLEKSKP